MEQIVSALRRDLTDMFVREQPDTRDLGTPKPARDVAPGECWAFTNHRTMAQVIAEGLC
jgi:hypothetical protein